MNLIDQIYVALIYMGSEIYNHIHVIVGGIMATTISMLKTAKEGKQQNRWENILCGVFAGIALTGLSLIQYVITVTFNLPEDMVVPTTFIVGLVSGAIAWHGTEGTVNFLKGIRGTKREENSGSNGGAQ